MGEAKLFLKMRKYTPTGNVGVRIESLSCNVNNVRNRLNFREIQMRVVPGPIRHLRNVAGQPVNFSYSEPTEYNLLYWRAPDITKPSFRVCFYLSKLSEEQEQRPIPHLCFF